MSGPAPREVAVFAGRLRGLVDAAAASELGRR